MGEGGSAAPDAPPQPQAERKPQTHRACPHPRPENKPTRLTAPRFSRGLRDPVRKDCCAPKGRSPMVSTGQPGPAGPPRSRGPCGLHVPDQPPVFHVELHPEEGHKGGPGPPALWGEQRGRADGESGQRHSPARSALSSGLSSQAACPLAASGRTGTRGSGRHLGRPGHRAAGGRAGPAQHLAPPAASGSSPWRSTCQASAPGP